MRHRMKLMVVAGVGLFALAGVLGVVGAVALGVVSEAGARLIYGDWDAANEEWVREREARAVPGEVVVFGEVIGTRDQVKLGEMGPGRSDFEELGVAGHHIYYAVMEADEALRMNRIVERLPGGPVGDAPLYVCMFGDWDAGGAARVGEVGLDGESVRGVLAMWQVDGGCEVGAWVVGDEEERNELGSWERLDALSGRVTCSMYCLDVGAAGVYMLGDVSGGHVHEVSFVDERMYEVDDGMGREFSDVLRDAEGSEEAEHWMVQEPTLIERGWSEIRWRWRCVKRAVDDPLAAVGTMLE